MPGDTPEGNRLLILGGTAEARRLAEAAVAAFPDAEIISSYAGRTARPQDPPGTVRDGGFGGAEGLAAYLRDEGIAAVVDATHPFAKTMSAHADAACRAAGVPRLYLARPAWTLPTGLRVTDAADMTAAAEALRGRAQRVFLSTGSQQIDAFAGLTDLWFLVRLIETPDDPLPLANHTVVTGRPPYTLDAERALLAAHGIDTLVSKASGGPLPAKITAAAEMGLPVVVVRRPAPPPGESVETVADAVAWLRGRL